MIIIKSITFYSLFLFLLLATSSKGQAPEGLAVGAVAPKFQATDQFNNPFDLEEQLKNGPVVMIFYRGHWCKYCNRQLEELSDSLSFIIEKGASVVTITPEIMEFVDETSKKYNNSFRILSDTDMKIMDAYKVRFEVDKGTSTKYKIWGIKLNEFNGDNGTNLPVPATYIIDRDGTIKYAFFNENYKKRVSIKTILLHL